jgi:streptomycin 6-kinase
VTDALQSYLSRWKLSGAEPLATTATSAVYLVDYNGEKAVLKLLTDLGQKDETGGAAALTSFNGHGAVRLLQHDKGAQLLEYAGGEDLKALVARGGDEEAAGIIASVLNQLHLAKAPAEGLWPLKTWFRALFEYPGDEPLFMRAAVVAEMLLKANEDPRVLHGDIHHENIRQSGRGWLALDPKGLYGPRLYDAANTLCNPAGMEALTENEGRLLKIAGLLAEKLAAPRQRVMAWVYAYAALSAAWSLQDKQDPKHALAIAQLAENHI